MCGMIVLLYVLWFLGCAACTFSPFIIMCQCVCEYVCLCLPTHTHTAKTKHSASAFRNPEPEPTADLFGLPQARCGDDRDDRLHIRGTGLDVGGVGLAGEEVVLGEEVLTHENLVRLW